MQKYILNNLKCLKCCAGTFDISDVESDNQEIREASIICKNCSSIYPVKNGIIYMLSPDKTVEKEQGGWVNLLDKSKNPEEWTDSFILALPNVEDPALGVKPENIAAWSKQADNFYAVIEKIKPLKDKLILDIGAGRCWSTTEFAERGGSCIAYDILPDKYLGLLSSDIFFQYKKIYFERVIGNMTKLPFADNTFDIVFSNCSLHHTTNLELTFKEISRVLKPGGVIAISNEPVKGLFRNREPSHVEIDAGINENIFTIKQWLKAISGAGLKGKILFPGSVQVVLEGCKYTGGFKHLVINLIRILWKLPGVKPSMKSVLRWPLHIFFGMGINFIGRKNEPY